MKVCEKKSRTSSSVFIVIPKPQAKMADLKCGDEVAVQVNSRKEIIIKKI